MNKRFESLLGILVMSLVALPFLAHGQSVVRGPYLQKLNTAGVTIKWRTDTANTGRVRYGQSPASLGSAKDELIQTTEHEVELRDLLPATRYYYSIGTAMGPLSSGSDHYFETAPTVGSDQPVRIWTFGDAGNGSQTQRNVLTSFVNIDDGRRADLMLLLGDNAYTLGEDAAYQTAVFDIYKTVLRNTPVWSTFGNHEGFSSISLAELGPYYDIFSFPKNGELGGEPSGTEAYYSFDHANIHFVCLNSHDVPRQNWGDMLAWLRRDLARNRQPWTIAYFHHPPYSKGSHDSDNRTLPPDTPESALSIKEMRENALPILEQAGVDLVLTGHSHSYERSFLLDGHYGTSETLLDSMKKNPGDGRPDGDGYYGKPGDVDADDHSGTVYAVVGTGGGFTPAQLDHPIMVKSLSIAGSMVIDVTANRLDAFFLDAAGHRLDNFTIRKGILSPQQPFLNEVADDIRPDQIDGVDTDGKYALSWTYPASPVEQPCGYRVEEASSFGRDYFDDAAEDLLLGRNSKWTSDGEWISADNPNNGSRSYSPVYGVLQDISLTQSGSVSLPANRAIHLSFDSFEDLEKNFDFGFLEISSDGGAFETLATYSGYFIGKRKIDLSAFAGRSIRLRFRFTTDFITAPPLLGWFIDNIQIEGSNYSQVGSTVAAQRNFDLVGRGNGTYAYRVAGLFGDCGGTPTLGPRSQVRQITVELGPPTYAPTATFTATPNPAVVGAPVSFDASASVDNDTQGPDPAIESYLWSFGDGSTYFSATPEASHSFAASGIYRVMLIVTDNEGDTAESEQYVVINQPQPSEIRSSGSGHILVNGKKASFGYTAQKSGASVSGAFEYHDRANAMKVSALSITSIQRFGSRVVIMGTCTINKQSGYTFTIDAVDGNPDTFRLRLSSGYDASGPVNGGQITIVP